MCYFKICSKENRKKKVDIIFIITIIYKLL